MPEHEGMDPAKTKPNVNTFQYRFNELAKQVNALARKNGFWEQSVDSPSANVVPLKLCLIHEEVSEALTAVRKSLGSSEKIPAHSALAEELADIVIRVMDLGHEMGIDMGEAIMAKFSYNLKRPYKHGKKF